MKSKGISYYIKLYFHILNTRYREYNGRFFLNFFRPIIYTLSILLASKLGYKFVGNINENYSYAAYIIISITTWNLYMNIITESVRNKKKNYYLYENKVIKFNNLILIPIILELVIYIILMSLNLLYLHIFNIIGIVKIIFLTLIIMYPLGNIISIISLIMPMFGYVMLSSSFILMWLTPIFWYPTSEHIYNLMLLNPIFLAIEIIMNDANLLSKSFLILVMMLYVINKVLNKVFSKKIKDICI